MKNRYIASFEAAQIATKVIPQFRAGDTVKLGANSIGVERIFPLYSDSLKSFEVIRRGRVRRAKLNFLRGLKGKAARIKELKRK